MTPIVVSRVLWAATGVPQLGLMRFYPKFESLRLGTAITHPAISRTLVLGISVCLVGAAATGIAMDRGGALGIASVPAAVTITDNSMKQAIRLAKAEVLYPAALLIGHYITLTICTTKSSANRLSEE